MIAVAADVGLEIGFGEASPSEASKAMGTFPYAEDLLDPPMLVRKGDLVDRAVPCTEPPIDIVLTMGPNTGEGDTRCAAASTHRCSQHSTLIGAVGKDITWIIRQCSFPVATIMGAPGRVPPAPIGIGADMGLVAVGRLSGSVTRPWSRPPMYRP